MFGLGFTPNASAMMGSTMGLERGPSKKFNYGTAPQSMRDALKNDPRYKYAQQELTRQYDYGHAPTALLGNLLSGLAGNIQQNRSLEEFGGQQQDYQTMLQDALAKRAAGQGQEATQMLLQSPYAQDMGMKFMETDEQRAQKEAEFNREAALKREMEKMSIGAQYGLENMRQQGGLQRVQAKNPIGGGGTTPAEDAVLQKINSIESRLRGG